MTRQIQHNKPCLHSEEEQAVIQTLRSKWLIAGKEVNTFEEQMRTFVGTLFAIAVNSGTAALHVSLLALNLQEGDEVILPTYTASDVLNAVMYVKATPILVDIAQDQFVASFEEIRNKISKKTKVIILPHTFGFPAPILELQKISIPIIEDCAQAVGTTVNGKVVGSFGKTSIFSFYASKLLTTGQGGMVLTNDKHLYLWIKDAIDYNGRDNYQIRYNYPMTDIAASIGTIQIKKYPEFIKRRMFIANQYRAALKKKGIVYWPKEKDTTVVPFRFLVDCEENQLKFLEHFFKHDIMVKSPVQSYELLHRLLKQNKKDFPYAEITAKKILSLPLYPCLSDEEIERVINAIQKL